MADYIDLYISNDDLTLDIAGEPVLIDDRDSIAQDIKHLIRETGLLVELVGERRQSNIDLNIKKLALEIEDDERLVPGTIKITRTDTETFFVSAKTVKFGTIELTVNL